MSTISKYNSVQSPVQDGIILKLNQLNSHRDNRISPQMMAVTPSPEDVLDAADNHLTGSNDEEKAQNNVFCCDPIHKRHLEGKKSTRRRRGPGQAVQVVFDHPPSSSEVRLPSAQTNPGSKSFASGPHSLSIISSAPQLNSSKSTPPTLTCTASTPPADSTKGGNSPNKQLTRHSSLRQPVERNRKGSFSGDLRKDENDTRNYDDMIKFILTEHGIKVISEKEFVV